MLRIIGIIAVFIATAAVAVSSPQIAMQIVRNPQDMKVAALIISAIAGCIGLPIAYLIYDRQPDYFTFKR